MASYSTIPAADVETEQPLLKRDVKLNVKTVLAGAAGAAFMVATGQRQCFEMKCGFSIGAVKMRRRTTGK